jgi:hypothetical protein
MPKDESSILSHFRQKRKVAASTEQRIKSSMNNQTTYTLLVRSEEKGRSILETVVYALCIVSAIVAIWQFVEQSAPPSFEGSDLPAHPAPVMSQHAVQAVLDTKS